MFTEILLFSAAISCSRKNRTIIRLALPIPVLYFRSLIWMLITYKFPTYSEFTSVQSDETNALSPHFRLYGKLMKYY